jgi:superoxide dismutase, Cu-Zn family
MKWQARGLILGLVAMAAGMSGACAADKEGSDSKGVAGITKAVCVLKATAGNNVSGTVTFTQQKDGVLVEAHVKGLKPNSNHGFHIHQFGDISSPDGKSTGGHFNPARVDHAGPNSMKRHWGDLGNLEADAKGNADYKRLDKVIQLHGEHTILSRGITIHAGEDDLKSQPTGAAGSRIAVGVIGLAKSE